MAVEISAPENSFQSAFRPKIPEPRAPERFDGTDAFLGRRLRDVLGVVLFAFFEARDTDDTLDAHPLIMPPR